MVDPSRSIRSLLVLGAALLVVAVGTWVMAGPELTQPEQSWPFDVRIAPEGPSAWDRLLEIHDAAIAALPGASPEERPLVERVLRASFVCVAFDGIAPFGGQGEMPPHAAGHTDAAAKVDSAWQALHRPPDPEHPDEWMDWQRCAEELEHGHE